MTLQDDLAMMMLSGSLFSDWGGRLYFIQSDDRVTYILLSGAILGVRSSSFKAKRREGTSVAISL